MTIAFCWSNDLIILAMLPTQNSKDESLSLVSRFIITGTVLRLNIGVQCLEKKYYIDSPYLKNHLQVCYLPGVIVSMKSYCHLHICFQDGPICFGSFFRVIKLISETFMVFQFGRTYSI